MIAGIGSHIKSFNSHGMVAIKDKEVQHTTSTGDRDRARRQHPSGQQVLHLEQEFVIDGQGGVRQR